MAHIKRVDEMQSHISNTCGRSLNEMADNMLIKELPKRLSLYDILHNKNRIINLVDTFGMDIPEDVDGKEFRKIFDKWAAREGLETNYYFAEELLKGLNKYLCKTLKSYK